jgi:hypothetical protein
MALHPASPLGKGWDTLDDYSIMDAATTYGAPPDDGIRHRWHGRWTEPDDEIGEIINVLPLPFARCPNCDLPLKPLMRGQIRMEPTREFNSLESGRAVICSECKHFITTEYAPVNEKWVKENYEHPFSKCVLMAMTHPVIPVDMGNRIDVARNATYAICSLLQEIVTNWKVGPIHPSLEEFKEASERLFASLVRRRMSLKELKDAVRDRDGMIGSMETVRFVETLSLPERSILDYKVLAQRMAMDFDRAILEKGEFSETRTTTETSLTLSHLKESMRKGFSCGGT